MVGYGALAYFLLPGWWHLHGHPSTAKDLPTITRTKDGIPGDPVNVGLVGTKEEVVNALQAAGWEAADPTTFRTSVRLCKRFVRKQAYPTAPMSSLYLWGRRQDLSHQQQVTGQGVKQRHHVRFWLAEQLAEDGRPLWLGAATFDRKVEISKTTIQVTHQVDAEIDAERDKLMNDLQNAGQVVRLHREPGVGATSKGRNGGGDLYFTDGERVIAVLIPLASPEPPP
jgi:hypothetical protein